MCHNPRRRYLNSRPFLVNASSSGGATYPNDGKRQPQSDRGTRTRRRRQPILTLAYHLIKIPRPILKRKYLHHTLSHHLPTTNQHRPLTTVSFVHSTKPRWRLNTSSSPREARSHKRSKNSKCRCTGVGRRCPRTSGRSRWDRWGYGRCCINDHRQVPPFDPPQPLVDTHRITGGVGGGLNLAFTGGVAAVRTAPISAPVVAPVAAVAGITGGALSGASFLTGMQLLSGKGCH